MDGDCASSILRRRIKGLEAEVQDELSEELDDVVIVAKRGTEIIIIPAKSRGVNLRDQGYRFYYGTRLKSK